MRSNKIVRSKAVFKFGLLCFLAGVLLSPALAQERTGEINGQVFDQTGAILPGVNVTVTNTASGRALMTLTVDDGSYHARDVIQEFSADQKNQDNGGSADQGEAEMNRGSGLSEQGHDD